MPSSTSPPRAGFFVGDKNFSDPGKIYQFGIDRIFTILVN